MSDIADGPLPDADQRIYGSYLLRIWRLERGGSEILRLTLINTRDGVERRFSRLEDLMRFLANPSSLPPSITHEP